MFEAAANIEYNPRESSSRTFACRDFRARKVYAVSENHESTRAFRVHGRFPARDVRCSNRLHESKISGMRLELNHVFVRLVPGWCRFTENRSMKRLATTIVGTALLVFPWTVSAVGHEIGRPNVTPTSQSMAGPLRGPSSTGQPNQSCSNFPETPGNSASAPGSAFNPSGNAGTHYAGQQPQNSRNTASVAQYDVACSHQK